MKKIISFSTIILCFFLFSIASADILVIKEGDLIENPIGNIVVIEKLNIGTEVEVIKKWNDWYKIKLADGKIGWVHESLCDNKEKEEENTWQSAKAQSAEDSYMTYINRYPRGRFVEQALESLRSIVTKEKYEKLVKSIKVKQLVKQLMSDLKEIDIFSYTAPEAEEYVWGKLYKQPKSFYAPLVESARSRIEKAKQSMNAVISLGDIGAEAKEAIPLLIKEFPSVMDAGYSEKTCELIVGYGNISPDESCIIKGERVKEQLMKSSPFFPFNERNKFENFIFWEDVKMIRHSESSIGGTVGTRLYEDVTIGVLFIFYPGAYALTKITGENFGKDEKKWQQWWEKNKAK